MNAPEQVPNDERLIKAVLAGDDEAFSELVRRYKPKVFRLAARFVRDNDELDDICQEAFIKAYQSLKKFRGDAPFEHWLTKIAVNVCYDMLRKQSRKRDNVPLDSVDFSIGEPQSPRSSSGSEAWDILKNAFVKLRPEDRLVITLLNLEEKSVRETASLTGWSEANVKVRAFRARKELKRILEDERGDDRSDDRIERLFAAARKFQPYNTNLEYGFETRVLAEIRERRDGRKPFFSWAWRFIPALVVVVMMLGAWTYISEQRQLIGLSSIAGINNEETMLVASLTGE